MSNFSNQSDVIDSMDIIKRIEELQAEFEEIHDKLYGDNVNDQKDDFDAWISGYIKSEISNGNEEAEEYQALKNLASQCENYGDWQDGETLVNRSYWVEYVTELIQDCYSEVIGTIEQNNGAWPYSCIKLDYEQASEELEADYMAVDFDGVEFLIRAR